jgi:hypothetical protein
MNYRKFFDTNELLDHLKAHAFVYYHAPLDTRPFSVRVKEYTVSHESDSKHKAKLWTSTNGTFTVKLAEHFDRFRIREDATS